MRITEALERLYGAISRFENAVKPIRDSAQEQINIADQRRAQDISYGRAPIGDFGRDMIFRPVVLSTERAPRYVRTKYIAPAASISDGLGKVQARYQAHVVGPSVSTQRALVRAHAVLNERVYRATVVEPTSVGKIVDRHLPRLLALVYSSARAQVEVAQQRARIDLQRADGLLDGQLTIEKNITTGQSVVVFSDERSGIIEQPSSPPSLFTRIKALVEF